jgi:hypothetical protein
VTILGDILQLFGMYRLVVLGFPGLPGGTLGDRLGTSIEFLPEGLRNRIKSGVAETTALGRRGSKAVGNTAGSMVKGFAGTDEAAGKLVSPLTHVVNGLAGAHEAAGKLVCPSCLWSAGLRGLLKLQGGWQSRSTTH